jgi:hypothetical protein
LAAEVVGFADQRFTNAERLVGARRQDAGS